MFLNERVLIYLAFLLFVIDFFTGGVYVLLGIDIKLSLIYKVIFLLLCLGYMAKNKKNYFYFSFFTLVLIILWAVAINITATPEYALLDFAELYKLFSTILVFFAFSNFMKYCPTTYLDIQIKIIFFVLVFNILLSYMGIGRFVYGDFGAIGFFQGGNALSGIIIIAAAYSMTKYIRKSLLKFLISIFVWITISILIGTKSSILAVLLISFCSVLLFKPKKGIITATILGMLIVTFFYISYEFIQQYGLYSRIVYFYDNGGLMKVLLSGREQFLYAAWQKFSISYAHEIIFGIGASGMLGLDKVTVEMDFFDIWFRFGSFFLIFYILLFFFVIFRSEVFSKSNVEDEKQLKHFIIISTFFLLITSFVAGHIIFNGMVTFLWGSVLGSLVWYKRYKINFE